MNDFLQSTVSALGRTPPHSIEAEEYILSCCMLDGKDVIARCREAKIEPDRLYETKNGIVLQVLYDLEAAGKPTEISAVAEELKTRRQLDQIGGYPFLTQISSLIPTTAQIGYFIEKVRESIILRAIIRACTGAVEDCYQYTGGLDEFVDQIEQKVFSVTQQRVSDRLQPSSSLVTPALNVLTAMIHRKGELTGVRTGFPDLDSLTWGFQRSDLIILAARPSMGKTSLALNIAENAAIPARGDISPVLFFSLEMTSNQLMQRMILSRAKVNMKLLRDGFLSRNGEESMRMMESGSAIGRAPLFIDDSSSITVSHIRARARRLHARTPLGMIVVDYLQLIAATNAAVSREQQVSEASRGLKALAKELNVPVIVLSQLNRASEKENRPPRLSDLRESGAIEQDADVVLMLSRPKGADEQFQVAADEAELIVAKQRNGPVGVVKLSFLRDITRFESFHR